MAIFQKAAGFARRHARALVVGAAAAVSVASVPAVASAATIEATFASTQTALVTEMGYAVALVVALLLIGLGVRMLVKWSRRGIASS